MSKVYLAFLFICFTNLAQAQVFKTDKGLVEFLSENLNGELNVADSTLDFYVDLSTLSTGLKLRDEHMRENHLETDDFPFAEFTGKVEGFNPAIADSQMVIAKGSFTIHGVSKDIVVEGKLIKEGNKICILAHFPVKLDDYNIKRPEFLFLKLSPEQKVTIKVELIN